MSESKSVSKFFNKLFSKSESSAIKLHYKPSKDDTIDYEDSDIGANSIHDKSKSLKRQQTCSFDLSDKTMRLRNTQELTSIDGTTTIHRTSSFDIDRDFPKKLLQITDFVEKEILGEGAFGRAIKVKHIKSGSFFVLKEVVSHSKENEESLIREISLLRSLKHNNILTTVGLVLKNKSICLLTELMEGGSLQAKIMNLKEEISWNQKLLFLRDIAAGMNFLHQHSIMHRDLTSSNCLIRKNNTVVVSDFGLSKFLNDDLDSIKGLRQRSSYGIRCSSTETLNICYRKRTTTHLDIDPTQEIRNFLSVNDISNFQEKGSSDSINFEYDRQTSEKRKSMNIRRRHTIVGNPFWMAPEMLAGKTYNCLVDLYSFGIIGCEITARISAHPDHLERHHKDMSINFPAFIHKNKYKELANCPLELLELVENCCNANPNERPIFNSVLSCLEDILFRITNNIQVKIRWSHICDGD